MTDKRQIQGPGGHITAQNRMDETGAVAGGDVMGNGIAITWQDGPVPEDGEPNGAFVEDVILAAAARLEYYQGSRQACDENERSLEHLRAALEWQDRRTGRRREQNVEGTTRPHEQETTGN